MRRLLFAVCLLPALASPAEAADPAPAPGTSVEMPFLIAPLNQDGKLAYYAYISTRLGASSESAVIEVRNQIAFIQDAFVRDVNRSSIGGLDDPKNVNVPALEARLLADARRIVGTGAVTNIHVTAIQFASLHPKQAPNVAPGD